MKKSFWSRSQMRWHMRTYAQKMFIMMCGSAILVSCGIAKDEYEAVVKSRDSLQVLLTDSESNMRTALDSLRRVGMSLEDLQANYSTLNDNYTQLRANSSTELQKAMERLEQAQNNIAAREQKLRDADSRLKEVEDKLRARDSAITALRTRLTDALFGFQNSGLSIDIRNGKVYVSLSNQLLFRVGSTTIDKQGQEALKGLAAVLNQQTDIGIVVEGHTDVQPVSGAGRFADNWDLSVLRSTEVIRYLTRDGGVDARRITAAGRGQFAPLDSLGTPDAFARNRRTEIILTPKYQELLDAIK